MKIINENTSEKYQIPEVGTKLNTDDRIRIFANLIIDRIIEDQKRGINHSNEELCTNKKMPLPQ